MNEHHVITITKPTDFKTMLTNTQLTNFYFYNFVKQYCLIIIYLCQTAIAIWIKKISVLRIGVLYIIVEQWSMSIIFGENYIGVWNKIVVAHIQM